MISLLIKYFRFAAIFELIQNAATLKSPTVLAPPPLSTTSHPQPPSEFIMIVIGVFICPSEIKSVLIGHRMAKISQFKCAFQVSRSRSILKYAN